MTVQRPRLCVVGSANIDLTFQTPRLPRPGETLAGARFHHGFGGKGANQAVMAARLGAQVTLIAKVGADVFGEQYLENLRGQGIDVTHVSIAEGSSTGTAAILVDSSAQNCIIVAPGANQELTPQEIRQAGGAIRSAQILIGQLEVPAPTTLEAFRLAKAAGVLTLLNPAPAGDLPDELLRLTDILVLNEIELEHIAEERFAKLHDNAAACLQLLRLGPHVVVQTLGEQGAIVFEREQARNVPGIKVDAVDTTGAGDAFIGSLAVFLVEGLDTQAAVGRANVAAALSVTRPGTQSSFPARVELEERLPATRET